MEPAASVPLLNVHPCTLLNDEFSLCKNSPLHGTMDIHGHTVENKIKNIDKKY